MYDGPDYDYDEIDALPMGLRLNGNGERRPSAILNAIRMDLQWVMDKDMENGTDWTDCQRTLLIADAMLAYVRSSSHLDMDLPVGDDDDLLDGIDPECYAIAELIGEFLSLLDKSTPLFTTYDWAADDRQTEGFDELGVWIDWKEITRHQEKGTMITVTHESELDDEDFVRDAMEQGAAYALVDDGENRLGIYRLGQTCMQEWLRE